MGELNTTPNANRLHIGIFGRTNSGKSSFINAFTGQQVSIVADVAGTTTDPVYKAMEINPLGPCVIIDTAGMEDSSKLGQQRMEKTKLAMEKTDLAVVVLPLAAGNMADYGAEKELISFFSQKKQPLLCIINTFGQVSAEQLAQLQQELQPMLLAEKSELLVVDCASGQGIEKVRGALAKLMPEDFDQAFITGDLVQAEDVVVLVMPQDIQAPKRRLILPQVQTIRELLDRKCIVVSTTTDKLEKTLACLTAAPKLIITDSQAFAEVYRHKPQGSLLTSFSVLFAAYKGDLPYYMEGAKAIDRLTESSRVLIAECCTHAPLAEDIGRVKIPNLLRKRYGQKLQIDVVSGTDFPEDPSQYDLIIQCGGCMFNRHYVLARIQKAKDKQVPMTNYGVTIAHLTGILDKIVMT